MNKKGDDAVIMFAEAAILVGPLAIAGAVGIFFVDPLTIPEWIKVIIMAPLVLGAIVFSFWGFGRMVDIRDTARSSEYLERKLQYWQDEYESLAHYCVRLEAENKQLKAQIQQKGRD